jgi:ankyrin repeat protein
MPDEGAAPPSCQDKFFAAIEAGEVSIVRSCLARDLALVAAIDSRQIPSFRGSQAAHSQHVGSGLGSKPAKSKQRDGETALHVAARHNQLEVARLLVTHGAEVNAQTYHGRTVLQHALVFGAADLSLIRFLVECGADINVGSSIIGIFSRTDWWEIIECLLKNGFNVRTALQKNGRTLLDAIVLRLEHPWNVDFEPIIETLLSYGADVNLSGRPDEDPPLVLAAVQGCVGVVRLLVSAGADSRLGSSRTGTALHAAAKHGSSGLVELLLAAGADPFANNNNGKTALELTQPYLDTLELVERFAKR